MLLKFRPLRLKFLLASVLDSVVATKVPMLLKFRPLRLKFLLVSVFDSVVATKVPMLLKFRPLRLKFLLVSVLDSVLTVKMLLEYNVMFPDWIVPTFERLMADTLMSEVRFEMDAVTTRFA